MEEQEEKTGTRGSGEESQGKASALREDGNASLVAVDVPGHPQDRRRWGRDGKGRGTSAGYAVMDYGNKTSDTRRETDDMEENVSTKKLPKACQGVGRTAKQILQCGVWEEVLCGDGTTRG